ncbi:hypothetical protein [Mariniflexile sp. HMF6888]|uniref:hypothetical protein n=1 Tax=Mariniflexile sp. HMF6888 TaxID=3373086 RepID=UPI0037AA5D29
MNKKNGTILCHQIIKQLIIVIALTLVIAVSRAQETVIIEDKLEAGATVGIKVGGKFTKEGFKPGIGQNHILYTLEKPIKKGYIEFEFKGMSHSELPYNSDQGFIGIYDGRGIEEPIQYSDDFKQNYYRWNIHWRQKKYAFKAVITCADSSEMRRNALKASFGKDKDRDWSLEPMGYSMEEGWEWDSNRWYKIRVEWKDKVYSVYFDGELIWQVSGPYDYLPMEPRIWLGSAPGYYENDKYKYWGLVKDLVYRNFKLVATR